MGSSWCCQEQRPPHRDGHDDDSSRIPTRKDCDQTSDCVVSVGPSDTRQQPQGDATTLTHHMVLHTAPHFKADSSSSNTTTAAMLAALSDGSEEITSGMSPPPPLGGEASSPVAVIISSPSPAGGREPPSFPEAAQRRSDSLSGSPKHKRVSIESSGRTSIIVRGRDSSATMADGPLKTSSVRGGSSVASLIRNNAAERSNCSLPTASFQESDLNSTTAAADPTLVPMISWRRTGSTSGGDLSGANMSELCSSQLCASVLAHCQMSNGSGDVQEQPPPSSSPTATQPQL